MQWGGVSCSGVLCCVAWCDAVKCRGVKTFIHTLMIGSFAVARNRMLKADICTSEQVNRMSERAELLFIKAMTQFDDNGSHVAKHMQLKAEVFPHRKYSLSIMKSMVNEIIDQGLWIEYADADYKEGDPTYWRYTGWSKHQKIDRPSKPKCPEFLVEYSTIIRRGLVLKEKGKGEVKEEGKESEVHSSSTRRVHSAPSLEEVQEYFTERGTSIDPEVFWSYYEAQGWKMSNGQPVKQWKRCLPVWEARQREKGDRNGYTKSGPI